MRELDSIVERWNLAAERGESAILATVVDVRGSAYRRPGARMLITSDGIRTGSISGGCLEGDVAKKAWWWTDGGQPVVRTYDTMSDGDAVWEFGLGCNGVIRVLLERVGAGRGGELKALLTTCREQRRPGVVATVISAPEGSDAREGQRLLLFPDGSFVEDGLGAGLIAEGLRKDCRSAAREGSSQLRQYTVDEGQIDVFLEVIAPPVQLLLFGAGHDALPVVRLASEIGWEVTVVDGRPAYATAQRFPTARRVVLAPAHDELGDLHPEPGSVAVVMNHNYPRDRAVLARLLDLGVPYIGMLGPRARTERMLSDLRIASWPEALHAPVGLDIGSDSPATIALAIVAEVQAALTGRRGGMLRNLPGMAPHAARA